MSSRTTKALIAGGATLIALGPGAALAAKGNVKFGGETEQGRKALIVVDSQGRAIRGNWTVLTSCDGRFQDFRIKIEMHKPLDRSTSDGFRDVASETESDDEVTARYKHEVEGTYKGKHEIKGTISAKVVFRRDGEKYVTCTADDLAFTVDELKAG